MESFSCACTFTSFPEAKRSLMVTSLPYYFNNNKSLLAQEKLRRKEEKRRRDSLCPLYLIHFRRHLRRLTGAFMVNQIFGVWNAECWYRVLCATFVVHLLQSASRHWHPSRVKNGLCHHHILCLTRRSQGLPNLLLALCEKKKGKRKGGSWIKEGQRSLEDDVEINLKSRRSLPELWSFLLQLLACHGLLRLPRHLPVLQHVAVDTWTMKLWREQNNFSIKNKRKFFFFFFFNKMKI